MQPYVGEIRIWPGNFPPAQWAFCQGQLLSISTFQTLFTLIGTTYGGDGQQTFALPNMQGRAPVHMGTGLGLAPVVLGQIGGSETVTLTQGQMPMHTHNVNVQNTEGNTNTPQNTLFANTGTGDNDYALGTVTPDVTMGTQSVSFAGGSQPYDIIQPSLALNFIISLYGIWPSQN
ncbi:phage tail protein [Mucilaginibacter agri]|uniref:Phage tail protein n=1 Tax=Mucilaginibacter agri TaxID=2695265 RepID=A0A965ZIF3_9SPHI|nr:tail fiber protein [Mucilaginibacter agri]NCD70236.1 phage tail protein [Mucilaginibacter agri]